jgi:hypothetical protein
MRTNNPSNKAIRTSESGQVWEEKLTNSSGTLYLPRYSTFRVRAASSVVTVTVDGVLAATMSSGEVMIFNSGSGELDGTPGVQVVITGQAYVQVARIFEN